MYTFIGTTDDITTCDRCGKSNLKRTVVLRSGEGDVVHFGADCAARALRQAGAKITTAAVNVQADAVAYAQRLLGKDLYTLDQVADAVSGRYGFSTDTRGGAVRILLSSIGAEKVFAVLTPGQQPAA